jgi:hypothetical protein
VIHDYFSTATALQRFEANSVREYRRVTAERLQVLADEYGMSALDSADTTERAWLEGVSEGLRTAAAEIAVPEEVVA